MTHRLLQNQRVVDLSVAALSLQYFFVQIQIEIEIQIQIQIQCCKMRGRWIYLLTGNAPRQL